MSDREQLRQLGAEINGVVDGLQAGVKDALRNVLGLIAVDSEGRVTYQLTRAVNAVLAEVAPVVAKKMQALHRALVDVERQDRIARARHEVAQQLRGELAVTLSALEVARRERDDARFELHKIRNQDLAGINLVCASEWCTYLAIDIDDLDEHSKECHPASPPPDPCEVRRA